MARATRTPVAPPPAPRGRRAAPAATPAKPPAVAPKPSKEDLRAQVETLEKTVAGLRTKNRELRKAARETTSRVAELEAEVERLQSLQAPPRPKRTRRSAEPDPGDGVPPGVAVLEPAPLDDEAKAAQSALEEHLSDT